MGRQIAGAVAGYLVMAVFIMVTFAIAFPLLGIERLFAPGTYEASTLWIALSFALGFTGALVGGMVAAGVGRATRAVHILAALVVALGVLSAFSAQGAADARGGPRGPDANMTDAMSFARQPLWISIVNPVVGALGVLIGGRRRT